MAYVVVVHLPPDYQSHLSELLQLNTSVPVKQVTQTELLKPDHVYVIAPGKNLSAIDSHLRVSDIEESRAARSPIDHFFRTLSLSHDGNSVGIILTGTGSDGTIGIQELKNSGALTIVQDPHEAEYDGVPRSAIMTGCVDLVLPLEDMIGNVIDFLRTEPMLRLSAEEEDDDDFQPLLTRLLTYLRTPNAAGWHRVAQPVLRPGADE